MWVCTWSICAVVWWPYSESTRAPHGLISCIPPGYRKNGFRWMVKLNSELPPASSIWMQEPEPPREQTLQLDKLVGTGGSVSAGAAADRQGRSRQTRRAWSGDGLEPARSSPCCNHRLPTKPCGHIVSDSRGNNQHRTAAIPSTNIMAALRSGGVQGYIPDTKSTETSMGAESAIVLTH